MTRNRHEVRETKRGNPICGSLVVVVHSMSILTKGGKTFYLPHKSGVR